MVEETSCNNVARCSGRRCQSWFDVPIHHHGVTHTFALSRSRHYLDAPHSLCFLGPIVGPGNWASCSRPSMGGFASFLYMMNVNALTADWPHVCRLGWSAFDRVC
ncbi:hypothetical protein EDD16DRAFT_1502550 [Pisolithus croceorrhizus]|nr:hypothetical protein EV401DRAFT_1881643 [Pisolithus croceorrhizus]KAI6094974.1 hypothetical protein EDD16DRAFT_1502550 [Pisolithus croceorrhizus]